MGVCIYLNLLFVIYFLYSFGYGFGYFQWNVQPKTIVCSGDDAHLVWNYTTNETASIFLWQKLGSQNILVARIFNGAFSVHTSYTGRVTQSYLGNAAIAIRSVNSSDSGTYSCKIQTVNSENVTLIVADQPSGMPYFNKTDNSLTCNPPPKLGSPPVETKLKLLPGGTVSSTLTTTKHGAYQCCISGEAVRCLASLDSTVTEFCVNETLDLETTTTTSITTEEGSTAAITNFTNKSTQHHSSSSSSGTFSASTNLMSVTTTVQSNYNHGLSKKSYTTYIIIGSVGDSALIVFLCVVAVVLRRRFTPKSDRFITENRPVSDVTLTGL